jgi:hypothetical protein
VISLVVLPAAQEADGVSRVQLAATVATSIAAVNSEVIFTTTDGSFATNVDNGNAKRARVPISGTSATVDLVAPKTPGPVSLTASVTGFTVPGLVTFGRALPNTVFVESTAAAMSRVTGTATITVRLLRDIGQVSDNTAVVYTATDSTGVAIGAFSNVKLATADRDGNVTSTATFNPDDTAALGAAVITAAVGQTSGTITVQLSN